MLLSDGNRFVYVSRADAAHFDAATGRERWRWASPSGAVDATFSLKGDAVMVRNGDRYVTIDAGRPPSGYDENVLLFVMRLLADCGADDL